MINKYYIVQTLINYLEEYPEERWVQVSNDEKAKSNICKLNSMTWTAIPQSLQLPRVCMCTVYLLMNSCGNFHLLYCLCLTHHHHRIHHRHHHPHRWSSCHPCITAEQATNQGWCKPCVQAFTTNCLRAGANMTDLLQDDWKIGG